MSKKDEKEQAFYRATLDKFLQDPLNKICSDCKASGPRWASPKLGVFICMKCAGIHRGLGVHISFVRSVTLDKWKESEVEDMAGGNTRAAMLYEASLPENFPRPTSDQIALEKFIRNKYVYRRYVCSPEQEKAILNGSEDYAKFVPAPSEEMSPAPPRAVVAKPPPVVRQPNPPAPVQAAQPQTQSSSSSLLNIDLLGGNGQVTSEAPSFDPRFFGISSDAPVDCTQQANVKNHIMDLLSQPAVPQQQQFPQQQFPGYYPGQVQQQFPMQPQQYQGTPPQFTGYQMQQQYPGYYPGQVQQQFPGYYSPQQPQHDASGLELLSKIQNRSQENRGTGLGQINF